MTLMTKLILPFLSLAASAETISHTGYQSFLYTVSAHEAYLGVQLTPEDHWHTYWTHPGDAGQTPYLNLADETVTVELMELPAPIRFETGGIAGYGFETETIYLFKLTGELPETLTGSVNWLICNADSCLSGEATFSHQTTIDKEVPSWLAKTSHPKGEIKLEKMVSATSYNELSDGVWEFSFASDDALAGWTVFPYDEKFSEQDGVVSLKKKDGNTYSFSFNCLGDLPDQLRFLLSDDTSSARIDIPR